jgi:hypothetical protein
VTDSKSDFTFRSLLALFLILGLSYLVLTLSSRFYYEPLCERYAESHQLTYDSYTIASPKRALTAECFFSDRNGPGERVQVSALAHTSADWIRWILSWIATIAGLGGSVWLASVVGGFKPKGKSRKRKSR